MILIVKVNIIYSNKDKSFVDTFCLNLFPKEWI